MCRCGRRTRWRRTDPSRWVRTVAFGLVAALVGAPAASAADEPVAFLPWTFPVNPSGLGVLPGSYSPTLVDLDADGDLDAVVGGGSCYYVCAGAVFLFENVGTAERPSFAEQVENPFGLATSEPFLTPRFGDLDGDGDLDALVGTGDGALLLFENVGDAWHPAFGPSGANPVGLGPVGGGARPALADIDDDDDLDVFVGVSDGSTHFFENVGTATTPAFAPPVADPFGLRRVGSRASPELADLDGDDDLDVAIGSGSGATFVARNDGSATSPRFGELVEGAAGIGAVELASRPTFGDLDGDGDLDVLVGSSGRVIYDVGSSYLFVNTGTVEVPAFAAPAANPFGIGDVVAGASPVFGDLDDDGDADALVGASDGSFVYFEHAHPGERPSFTGPTVNPFGLTSVDSRARPALADLDGDGDLDLLSGNYRGASVFYENVGTPEEPAFAAPVTNPFGLSNVGDLNASTSPALTDIDADGDFDAFISALGGSTYLFENVGTAEAPAFVRGGSFGLTNIGGVSGLPNPSFGDVDGDGDPDALIGSNGGRTVYFENVGTPRAPAFGPPRYDAFGLSPVYEWADPALVDIDGDGDLDALVGDGAGATRFFEHVGTLGRLFRDGFESGDTSAWSTSVGEPAP